jgi:fumarylpyruvate hydrolase
MNVQKSTATFAVEPAPQPVLPVEGSDLLFPVRRVYCVGRNFAAHAIEMGSDPNREPPFFFQKNPNNLLVGRDFPYPVASNDVHHEIEMVVAIAKGGKDIPVAKALEHVFGYAVGLDMTRRDIQGEAKKHGRPWDMAKGFDHSAPCAPIHRATTIGHPSKGAIWLKVNGELRQKGDLSDMIWSVAETISYLSGLMELVPGDLIYTGTPEGVGPTGKGDQLFGHIDGIGDLSITIG